MGKASLPHDVGLDDLEWLRALAARLVRDPHTAEDAARFAAGTIATAARAAPSSRRSVFSAIATTGAGRTQDAACSYTRTSSASGGTTISRPSPSWSRIGCPERSRREGRMIFYALDDKHVLALFKQGLRHVQEAGR